MSKDKAIMDQDQNHEAIQVLPLRPIAAGVTDGAFEPIVLAAAGVQTATLNVSDSTVLRWEARDANGDLKPVNCGIDGELSDAATPQAGDEYEFRAFDVVGCSAVETVRFTIGADDVTITGRRA